MDSMWDVDEDLIERFEESWARNDSPNIQEFLRADVSQQDLGNLFELVVVDMEFRWKRFDPLSEDSAELHPREFQWYVDQWSLLNQTEVREKLLEEEFVIRRKYGDHPAADTYRELYPELSGQIAEWDKRYSVEITAKNLPTNVIPTIANYHILRVIGEGGMGSVYLAKQEHPVRRQVALKVIRTGLNSKEVIARFEAERQALALMDHQNIARIYEAGTTESDQPFFAMEYVQGISLTQYCSKKQLSISQRLDLFLGVCAAVQHAHQKGILHRDLKPSNVIIGEENGKALTKVIDFGLAKTLDNAELLTDKTMQTHAGQVLGTLKYMSPEQAGVNEKDIDTRADVYALGVLLYELLTGETPLDEKTLADQGMLSALEMIRDLEPQRPSTKLTLDADSGDQVSLERSTNLSTLRQVLRGDLDWVVMKALENDRERRYESVSSFADDIRRFLNDEPVIARPPSTSYRVRKFAKKNRVLVTSALSLLTLLILGIATTTWQAVRASRAEQDADQQKKVAIGNAEESEKRRIEADALRELETEARQEAVRAVKDMEFQNYIANLNRVHMAMQIGNRDEAEQVLMQCPQAHRGLEWNMLYNQVFGAVLELSKHSSDVWRALYSPDGNMIVSTARITAQPCELFCWNANTGDLIRKLEGHRSWVQSMDISDDGRLLVTAGGTPVTARIGVLGSNDADLVSTQSLQPEVLIWDIQTGELLRELNGHGDDFVFSCKFVPNSQDVVTTTYSSLFHFSAETTEPLSQTSLNKFDPDDPLRNEAFDSTGVPNIEFSQDGKRILVMGRGLFQNINGSIERVETRELLDLTAKGIPTTFGFDGVGIAEFVESFSKLQTKNYQLKMTAFGVDDGFLTSGESLVVSQHSENVTAAEVSPVHPQTVLSADDGGFIQMTHWRLDRTFLTPIKQHKILAHQGRVNDISFRPDGKRFVSCGEDRKVRVWSSAIPQGQLKLPSRDHFGSFSIGLSGDGELILDHNGRLFQTSDGTPLTDERHLPAKTVGALDDNILNDPVSLLNTLSSERDYQYYSIKISPNQQRFIHYGGVNSFAEILSLKTLEQIAVIGGNQPVVGFGGKPKDGIFLDDQRVAVVRDTGDLITLDLEQNLKFYVNDVRNVTAITTSKRQDLLFVAHDQQLTCFNTKTWDTVFQHSINEEIEKIAVTADGQFAAIVSAQGITLWDTKSKKTTGQIVSPKLLKSLLFSKDGSRLLTLATDRTLTFWHVASQTPLLSLRVGEDFANDLQLSDDNHELAFGSLFTTVINTKPPE